MMPALPRPMLIAATFSAALCWAAAGVAASTEVDPVAPQPKHAPTAPLSAQELAAEKAQLARPNPLQSRAAAEPERASVRLSVGLGGGSVGIAARAAADVEYWPFDNAGIGLLGALGGQSAVFGNTFSYSFLGPALVLRNNAAKNRFLGTAAFGLMHGGYTHNDAGFLSCDLDCESVSYDIQAPGVVLNAGVLRRTGSVDLGGALAVDLISAELETSRWLYTVTLNFIASIPL